MAKKFFYRVFCGFFLGLSVFAPGFSGSVIAIIMGIYQDIVRIASNPFKKLKQNILFCLPLGIGALLSGVLFVVAFKFLFETYEKATYLLFIGLIAGNLPVIYREIKKSAFRAPYLAGGLCAFAAALALGIFAARSGEPASVDALTASLALMMAAGFLAGVTALVPGMSVSMILILLGVYGQVIFAAESLLHLSTAALLPLALFLAWALIGLVLASRGIKAVFERFPGFANSAVFGFMAGSLIGLVFRSVWLQEANFSWLMGGGMLVAGLVVSLLFVVLGTRLGQE